MWKLLTETGVPEVYMGQMHMQESGAKKQISSATSASSSSTAL